MCSVVGGLHSHSPNIFLDDSVVHSQYAMKKTSLCYNWEILSEKYKYSTNKNSIEFNWFNWTQSSERKSGNLNEKNLNFNDGYNSNGNTGIWLIMEEINSVQEFEEFYLIYIQDLQDEGIATIWEDLITVGVYVSIKD